MRVSSAEYLINHAVKSALELQRKYTNNANKSTAKTQRGKAAQKVASNEQEAIFAAAYRVSISPAAMQKMATFDNL